MSLFDLMQDAIIEKPRQTWTYKKIKQKQKEQEMEKEVKTEKQIRREMKEKLSEKEYKKRYANREYVKRKDLYRKKYEERQAELQKMLLEICDELWPGNDLTDYDDFYTKKFKIDDTVKDWKYRKYKFIWWSSKLAKIPWAWLPKQTMPFRISNRQWIESAIKEWMKIQHTIYQYLKPLMWELEDSKAIILRRWPPRKHPSYYADDKLRAVAKGAPFNDSHTYMMFEGMKRNKYMLTEMYLGRTCFIFGDVVVTETWNIFRIALNNNLPWLTKDTVEDIHKLRMDWYLGKSKDRPPIYLLNDAYLVKVPLKWQSLFYIIPT